MTLDFHYQSANLVKYRTDVTFGWLDLMVSFGGIAGLFLGCSILSGVEIFYYIIIVALLSCRRLKLKFDKILESYSKDIRVRDIEHERKCNKKKNARKKIDNVQTIKVISIADIDRCNAKDAINVRY
jgi:hypothetical protein